MSSFAISLNSIIILIDTLAKMPNDLSKENFLPPIVLASASPRRAEILRSVGWPFQVIVPDIDESPDPNEMAAEYVKRLAVGKALAVRDRVDALPVLAADTTVVLGDSIIGKPADFAEAKRMIGLLSGRWHEVLTGVAIATADKVMADVQRTRVRFANLSEREIEFLSRAGNPLDKAGAYAVQGAAALFIEAIEGDYWNVVGLPISLVYSLYFRNLGTKK